MGEILPTSLPERPIQLRDLSNNKKSLNKYFLFSMKINLVIRLKNNFFKTKFGDVLTKLGVSRRFQPGIYTVVHEESESEVQNVQILQGNLTISVSSFQNKHFLNPIRGVDGGGSSVC